MKKGLRKAAAIGFFLMVLTMPAVSFSREGIQEWELVHPEGVIKIEPMKINAHPTTLVGKTVLLRSNGKHNADHYLTRVAELLQQEVRNLTIIKSWEVAPETNTISQNPDKSKQFAQKLASFKPDLVIGSQCD